LTAIEGVDPCSCAFISQASSPSQLSFIALAFCATTNLYYNLKLKLFASVSAIRLLKPANDQYAPFGLDKLWQVFRLADLLNPRGHIGFAGYLYAYRFPITYRQYVEYME
jgi:hypothetical protein